MDYSYLLNVDGQNIEVEFTDTAKAKKEQAKRLVTYYSMFLKSQIDTASDKNKQELLQRIIDSLSDDGIVDMMSKLKDEKGKADVINSVNELMEAYEGEDFNDFIDEEINGNLFTYLKGFDIEAVREKLVAVGEEVKGKKWLLNLDDEGKLVLSE